MIMKLNVSNELKSRLTHAAENGSVIAKDILSEVKKNVPVEEVIRGSYNFFSTKRKRTEAGTFKKIRIVFTACNKDLGHPNFPDRNNHNACKQNMSFWTVYYSINVYTKVVQSITPHRSTHGPNQTSTHKKRHYPHNQNTCSAE